jgi:hypothetical protein
MVKWLTMSERCLECGAPLPDSGDCRDHFHTLLYLESEIPETAGSILHFYAVACYVLQHPDSFNYTADTLAGLRANLADALDGRATVAELRRRACQADGPMRITRRPGDDEVPWHRSHWPVTVVDVCFVEPEHYVEQLLRWAHSVRETLDAHITLSPFPQQNCNS